MKHRVFLAVNLLISALNVAWFLYPRDVAQTTLPAPVPAPAPSPRDPVRPLLGAVTSETTPPVRIEGGSALDTHSNSPDSPRLRIATMGLALLDRFSDPSFRAGAFEYLTLRNHDEYDEFFDSLNVSDAARQLLVELLNEKTLRAMENATLHATSADRLPVGNKNDEIDAGLEAILGRNGKIALDKFERERGARQVLDRVASRISRKGVALADTERAQLAPLLRNVSVVDHETANLIGALLPRDRAALVLESIKTELKLQELSGNLVVPPIP